MAQPKAEDERIMSIHLRRDFITVPRGKRGKRALSHLRLVVSKAMKADNVKISQKLNEKIWRSGGKKPLPNVKVKVKREGDAVYVRLPDEKPAEIKKEAKSRLDKLKQGLSKDSAAAKKPEPKPGAKPEAKPEARKVEKAAAPVASRKPESGAKDTNTGQQKAAGPAKS